VSPPETLVVDLGGHSIKVSLGSDDQSTRMPSGRKLVPETFIEEVRAATSGWHFDRISIGCPGPVRDNQLVLDPFNLGPGWVGRDLSHAFAVPTRVVNDAAMQALGSYEGGKMLFLGLGTGLGAALVVEKLVLSLELAHLPYRDGLTFEDFVGQRGLDRLGLEAWRAAVKDVIDRLRAAMVADNVVLGGGNARRMDPLPEACRRGSNANAIRGGLRLWEPDIRVL
jgi:predicted NBD/HSP70 family sugar kinase